MLIYFFRTAFPENHKTARRWLEIAFLILSILGLTCTDGMQVSITWNWKYAWSLNNVNYTIMYICFFVQLLFPPHSESQLRFIAVRIWPPAQPSSRVARPEVIFSRSVVAAGRAKLSRVSNEKRGGTGAAHRPNPDRISQFVSVPANDICIIPDSRHIMSLPWQPPCQCVVQWSYNFLCEKLLQQ